MSKLVLSNMVAQTMAGIVLMKRYRTFAKSIGCTTYDDGSLCDTIEIHTGEQAVELTAWWAANRC